MPDFLFSHCNLTFWAFGDDLKANRLENHGLREKDIHIATSLKDRSILRFRIRFFHFFPKIGLRSRYYYENKHMNKILFEAYYRFQLAASHNFTLVAQFGDYHKLKRVLELVGEFDFERNPNYEKFIPESKAEHLLDTVDPISHFVQLERDTVVVALYQELCSVEFFIVRNSKLSGNEILYQFRSGSVDYNVEYLRENALRVFNPRIWGLKS